MKATDFELAGSGAMAVFGLFAALLTLGWPGEAQAVKGRCIQVSEDKRVCIRSSIYEVPQPGSPMRVPTAFIYMEGDQDPTALDLIKCVEFIFPENVKNPRRTNCERDRGHQGFAESFSAHDVSEGPEVKRVDAIITLVSGEVLPQMRANIRQPKF